MNEYNPWDALVSDIFLEPLTLTPEGVAVLRDTLISMASRTDPKRNMFRNTAILWSRYGIDASTPRKQTQAEVGAEFGLTGGAIGQVLRRDLRMLLHPRRTRLLKPHLRRPDGSPAA